MMTRQHVSAGQASSYYEADDYYTEGGLMPAQWGGKLAADLGLSGDFDQKKFSQALRGEFAGHEFKQRPSPKRAGLDCCFSAPKSVSIMALVKGDSRIIAAHDRAVKLAMERVEAAARCRLTQDGKTTAEAVSGIAFASFRHDTSRLADANLHTHNVVFKAVMGPDGQLRALDADKMFATGWRHEMDATYKAVLAQELRAMGYSLVMTKDGFEIEGVAADLIADMSQRRQQILESLRARGIDPETASAIARQKANLDSRPTKNHYDRDALRAWWTDRVAFLAKVLGKEPAALTPAIPPHTTKELDHDRNDNQPRNRQGAAHSPEIPAEAPPFRRDRMHHLSELDVARDPRAAMLLPGNVSDGLEREDTAQSDELQRDRDWQERAERTGPGRDGGTAARGDGDSDAGKLGQQLAEVGSGLPDRLSPEIALAQAIENAMEREAVIANRHGLLADAIQFSEFNATAEQIDKAIEAAIVSGELIVAGERMTTRAALEAEAAVYAAYDAGRGVCEAIAEGKTTAEGIAAMEKRLGDGLIAKHAEQLGRSLTAEEKAAWYAKAKLSEGQRVMVENITLGTNRLMIVEGDAGTGKSTGMEAVKRIAEAKGFKVLGLAPSKQAVDSLQAAGIDTITSQSAKANERFWENVNSKTVLILDEAGLVDVRTMRTLLEKVAEKGARIAVVGDDKQFASVEAGRALYQLNEKAKEYGEEIRLSEMRRWQNETMKSLHFSSRDDPLAALDQLFAEGNAQVYQNDERRINALAEEYAALTDAERVKSLVLTGTNKDRVAINTAIREALGREGGIEVDTFERFDTSKTKARQLASYEEGYLVRFESATDGFKKGEMCRVVEKTSDKIILERTNGTRVDFHPHSDAQSVSIGSEERIAIAAGERIRFTTNDNSQDKRFANGDRGTVVAIEKDKLHIRLDKGKDVVVPLDGKTALPLRYGYAMTGHSAQGGTATNVFMHIKSTDRTVDRKSWYTNITRAAVKLQLFTDALEGKRLAALRQAISYTNNKELAHEVIGEKAKAKAGGRLNYIGQGKGIGREDLAKDSDKNAIAKALASMQKRFAGESLHVEGGKALKEQIAQVVVDKGIDVKFTDKALNNRVQELQAKNEAKAQSAVPAKPASDTKGGAGQSGKGDKLKQFVDDQKAKIEREKEEKQKQQQQQQEQRKKHNHSHNL